MSKHTHYQFMNGVDAAKLGWMAQLPDVTEEVNKSHLDAFFMTMYERQCIWVKRFIRKEQPPWTENPYLRDYKFTNVYRELDRASQWMIHNILRDHDQSVKDMLLKLMLFRFYNQPDTFDKSQKYHVELPNKCHEFDAQKMWEQTVDVRDKGKRNPWHTAYMMNMAFIKKPADWSGRGLFKDEAYVKTLFPAIHDMVSSGELCSAYQLADKKKDPSILIEALEKLPATSGFQSHEFYVDFCYVAKYWKRPLMKHLDQNSYTNVGPGASLGLRLIFPSLVGNDQKRGIYVLRDIASDYLKHNLEVEFPYLYWNPHVQKYGFSKMGDLTLHQIEMWLCEYSKYWKMTIKEGKQRSKFKVKSTGIEF